MYSENPRIDAESFLQSQSIDLFFQPYQEGINLNWNKLHNVIMPKHHTPQNALRQLQLQKDINQNGINPKLHQLQAASAPSRH